MNAIRDWAALGITWTEGEVKRQHGDHASDRVVLGTAQIPQLADVGKAIAAGLGDAILSGVNGTSWRVTAQDVERKALEAKLTDVELRRERVWSRIISLRNAPLGVRTVTKIVAILPDGTQWSGDNVDEFEAQYTAGLLDAGMDTATAKTIAKNVATPLRK